MSSSWRNRPEAPKLAPELVPLFSLIVGAFFGSGAVPDESSWLVASLGGLIGAALFFVVGNYIRAGARRRGTWNPYSDGWKAIITGAAVVMPLIAFGVIVSLLIEAGTGMEFTWLVSFFSTLGLAAAGLYLGRALRARERTPSGAFIGLSYLLFTMTFSGFVVARWIAGGGPGNEGTLATGSLTGATVALVVWLILLKNRREV